MGMVYMSNKNNKGLFIVLEGGDGTGKSTQAKLIKEYIETEYSKEVVLTREPGGVDTAEMIREIILNQEIDAITEALLFASARREHLVKKVIPALKENKIVICDRFLYSSLAYQGYARKIGIENVYNINLYAIEDCFPDLTIMLDLNAKDGIDRILNNRTDEINRLDKEGLDFHSNVREGYKIVSQIYNDELFKVDASKNIEGVFEQIKPIIDNVMQNKK